MRAGAFSLSEVFVARAFGGLVLSFFDQIVSGCLFGPGLPREKLGWQLTDLRVVSSEISPRDAHVAGSPFTSSALCVETRMLDESACVPARNCLGQVVNYSTTVALD